MSAPIMAAIENLPKFKRSGAGFVACCPGPTHANGDRNPSLSVTPKPDRVLLKCHAGCANEAIVAALDMKLADLFEPKTNGHAGQARPAKWIVATYDYTDENADLIYQTVRYEPKDFKQRRPDGNGGWIYEKAMEGIRRVLFNLPEIVGAPGQPVVVVEGEKDAERLMSLGILATTSVGGAGKWRPEYTEHLVGRKVVVIPDNDKAGLDHVIDIARSLDGKADVHLLNLPGLPPKGDVSDWLDAGGTVEQLRDLIAAAPPIAEPELVTLVTDKQGIGSGLAGVLDALLAHLRLFVWFAKPEQAVAVALWIAHTHCIEAVEQSPVLAISSPVKQSGKSRLLDVIETVVPRPWRIERPSEAVLYRRIERDHPTILMDEADTIFGDRSGQYEGIRAVFNAGNRRGTVVSRVMPRGQTMDLIDFTIFGPKSIAGIGRFPETIVDRSIVIAMTRKGPTDAVERLRSKRAAELGSPICDALSSILVYVEELSLRDDQLPTDLDDRGQDNWESLIALADLAAGQWPALARSAAVVLQGDRADADDNAAITLLIDLYAIFGDEPFLPTAELLEQLHAIESSPWSEWKVGKPITARGLAKLLDPFGIHPDRTRAVRGYNRRELVDAWERFLPLTPSVSVTSVTPVTEAVVIPIVEVVDQYQGMSLQDELEGIYETISHEQEGTA